MMQVADSIKVAVDSVSVAVGMEVGAQISTLVALGLGVAVKFMVDLGKKGSAAFAGSPDWAKALVAVVFGQVAVFVSSKTGVAFSSDIAVLDVSLAGLVVSVASMGFHGLVKSIRKAVTK